MIESLMTKDFMKLMKPRARTETEMSTTEVSSLTDFLVGSVGKYRLPQLFSFRLIMKYGKIADMDRTAIIVRVRQPPVPSKNLEMTLYES